MTVTESERREIRRVMARLQTGDRAGARDALAVLVAPARARPSDARQLRLASWADDADGLPPGPWRIHPDAQIECKKLQCRIPAIECVTRQARSDMERTRDTWRGQGGKYPLCVTSKCAQGRGIRLALDPEVKVGWKGAGPGGRFDRGRSDEYEQEAARARMKRTGLLEAVRTIDVDPDPVEE